MCNVPFDAVFDVDSKKNCSVLCTEKHRFLTYIPNFPIDLYIKHLIFGSKLKMDLKSNLVRFS